jgi:hypothetical protein
VNADRRAAGDAPGVTSGEVADRLRLAIARLGRRLVHTHPDAGMTPSRLAASRGRCDTASLASSLTALGALEAAGPLRIASTTSRGTGGPPSSPLFPVLEQVALPD